MYRTEEIQNAVMSVKTVLAQVKTDLKTHMAIQDSMEVIDSELQTAASNMRPKRKKVEVEKVEDNGNVQKDVSGAV